MFNRLLVKTTLAAAVAIPVTAQATNADHLLGVTAMQWGMGGAIIAAPLDSAIIFSNPAGIAELGIEEARFDLSPGFFNPRREVNGNESDSEWAFLPSGSAAFNVNDRVFLGFGMAAQSGFGVDFSDVAPMPGNQPVVTTKGFFRLSPSAAYRVNDRLSIGGSINIGFQSLALSNTMFTFPQNQQFGFGISLGAVYHINNQFQLGASWISKTNMSDHEYNTVDGKFSVQLDVPQKITVGMAYKPSDSLLMELDVKWINFSDTMDSLAIGRPPGYVGTVPPALMLGWDDQTVIAFGLQKSVNDKTQLRMGVNYGASPIEADDVDNNIGSLAITEWHLSLGATRYLSKKVSGSISYTHAFENELTSSTSPNTISLEQNILYLQLAYQH